MRTASTTVSEGLKLPGTLLHRLYDSGMLAEIRRVEVHPGNSDVTICFVGGAMMLCTFLGENGWSFSGSAVL